MTKLLPMVPITLGQRLEIPPNTEGWPKTLRRASSPTHEHVHHDDSETGLKDSQISCEASPKISETTHSKLARSGSFRIFGKSTVENGRLFVSCVQEWRTELAAIAFCIACMLAVIALLVLIHNKSLSEWDFPIRPNSVVAIFITAATSSMLLVMNRCINQLKWIYFQQQEHSIADMELFDSASRGPLGSSTFLWRVNRRAVVSSGCAIVTLLALVMAPFAQQVIRYSTENVPVSKGTALLPFTRKWAIAEYPESDPSPPLTQFFERGNNAFDQIFSTADINLNVRCPSGNCTFPEYETLGVCSKCTNVTTASTILDIGHRDVKNNLLEMNVRFVTPQSIEFNLPFMVYHDWWTGPFIMTNATRPTLWSRNSSAELPKFAVARVSSWPRSPPPLALQAGKPLNWQNLDIYDCELFYCAMTRLSYVTNGKLHDRAVGTLRLSISNTSATKLHTHFSDPKYCVYTPIAMNLVWHIFHFFKMHVNTQGNSSGIVNLHDIFRLEAGPQSALWWSNDGNIPKTIEGIAEGITKFIRNSPTSEQLPGNVLGPATVIHVEWLWLFLALAVVLLATLMLLASITLSNTQSRVVWKSSALAPLFHGLSGWQKGDVEDLSVHMMKEKARTMLARLCEDDRGDIKLVRIVDQQPP